jgi:hypothetical protein
MSEAPARIDRSGCSRTNQPIKCRWHGNGLNSICGITPWAVDMSAVLRYNIYKYKYHFTLQCLVFMAFYTTREQHIAEDVVTPSHCEFVLAFY